MTKINFFIVNKDHEGRRLDNFLFSKFKKGIPKSKIYSSIRKAKIKVNGRKTKPDYKLQTGDKIGYPELVQKTDINDSPNLQDHIDYITSHRVSYYICYIWEYSIIFRNGRSLVDYKI